MTALAAASLATAGAAAQTAPRPDSLWLGPWTRAATEPVIRPDATKGSQDPISGKPAHWEALHTFNPAAVVRNGKVYVLYRAGDDSRAMAQGSRLHRRADYRSCSSSTTITSIGLSPAFLSMCILLGAIAGSQ